MTYHQAVNLEAERWAYSLMSSRAVVVRVNYARQLLPFASIVLTLPDGRAGMMCIDLTDAMINRRLDIPPQVWFEVDQRAMSMGAFGALIM